MILWFDDDGFFLPLLLTENLETVGRLFND